MEKKEEEFQAFIDLGDDPNDESIEASSSQLDADYSKVKEEYKPKTMADGMMVYQKDDVADMGLSLPFN